MYHCRKRLDKRFAKLAYTFLCHRRLTLTMLRHGIFIKLCDLHFFVLLIIPFVFSVDCDRLGFIYLKLKSGDVIDKYM